MIIQKGDRLLFEAGGQFGDKLLDHLAVAADAHGLVLRAELGPFLAVQGVGQVQVHQGVLVCWLTSLIGGRLPTLVQRHGGSDGAAASILVGLQADGALSG